jgi:hypothetical protein
MGRGSFRSGVRAEDGRDSTEDLTSSNDKTRNRYGEGPVTDFFSRDRPKHYKLRIVNIFALLVFTFYCLHVASP